MNEKLANQMKEAYPPGNITSVDDGEDEGEDDDEDYEMEM